MRSRRLLVLAAFALAPVTSCSSANEGGEPFADPMVSGPATSPEGAPYPTDHLGGTARIGKRRGDRIPNFSFSGYRESDRAAGLKVVSLADYYDPSQRHGKVLHLMVAAVWCSICDAQTREMSAASDRRDRGLVIVQALANGKRYERGPSLDEVGGWIDRYPTWFTVVIDDRAKRIGTVASVDAFPWNAVIDLRTMEILAAGVGKPSSYAAYVDAALDWVAANPPSY